MKKSAVFFISFCFFCASLVKADTGDEKLVFTYPMGSFTLTLLSEMQREGNADILIGATQEMLQQEMPQGSYPSAVNAFLIETPERVILVDAGFGINLFNNLAAINKTPEEINIILLTHMHGDHIGGLLRDGMKSFPNAELYISRMEYTYWTSKEQMQQVPENKQGGFINAQKVVDSYQNNLHLFDPEETDGALTELFPGIRAIAAYGHTPGHTGYLVESEEMRLFIWGDLVNCMPIQVPYPQVATVHDIDPVQASLTREKLFRYLSENKIQIAGMHIAYPGIGNINIDQDSFRFTMLPENNGK